MSRKRTGLRNRHRTGRSTYSRAGKHDRRDTYGTWSSGRQDRPEVIAGRTLSTRTRPPEPIAGKS